jgi:hypothetical protein
MQRKLTGVLVASDQRTVINDLVYPSVPDTDAENGTSPTHITHSSEHVPGAFWKACVMWTISSTKRENPHT